MVCKNCGTEVKEGQKFCENCGTKIEEEKIPVIEEPKKEEVKEENKEVEVTEIPKEQENVGNLNQSSNQNVSNPVKKSSGLKIASLVIGIINIVFSFIFNLIMMPLEILGLILGIIHTVKEKKFCAGIVLNIVAIIISIIMFVIMAMFTLKVGDIFDIKTSDDGEFSIEFNSDIADEINKTIEDIDNKINVSVYKDDSSVKIYNSNKSDENQYDKGYKFVGSEKNGYIKVPEKWAKFVDIAVTNVPNMIQYSNADVWILTMMPIENQNNLTTYTYSNSLYKSMKSENVEKLKFSSDLITDEMYFAYKITGYYEEDNTWLKIWIFKDDEDNMHYVSVEGPEEDSEYFDLIDTFTIEK